jgi:hypothetical protein
MAEYSTTPKTPLEKELDRALHKTLVWNDELQGKVKSLQAKLDGLLGAFEKGGSLALLQEIGADKNLPADTRIKALSAAVAYERSKPASSVNVGFKLYDFLEERRLKDLEAREKAKTITIEHDPKVGSILGHDGAGEALDTDPAA